MKRVMNSTSKYATNVIRRISLLEQMNEVMKSMNNEDAYLSWIYTVPDEATRQDFEYIAQDDELYQEYNFAKSCDRRLALGDIEILN